MSIILKRGDCVVRMKEMDEGSIDAIVSDPPYEIGFMAKSWDKAGGIATSYEYWSTVMRVLAPGGVVKVFGGSRTFHRMADMMEKVGFKNIRLEGWTYGCLSADTEILTEDGWKLGLSVKVGEKVACWDPKTDQKSFLPVQETHYGPYQGDMLCIGPMQVVTPNHKVFIRRESEWEAAEASSLEVCVSDEDYFVKETYQIPVIQQMNDVTDAMVESLLVSNTTMAYDDVVWCVRVPTGAFIARRNGLVFITGNSGFPKNHNVSRAIDKKLGGKRGFKIVPFTGNALMRHGGNNSRPWMEAAQEKGYHEVPDDDAVTTLAKLWQGWGSALKPAWEPIVIADKPL